MLLRRIAAWTFTVGLAVLGTEVVSGQNYPNKPIRIVTAGPASGSDLASRLIAQGLAGDFGQPVVVENRGGAGGAIAIGTAAKALPDGYTLLLYSNAMWILPLLRNNVPYDPEKDFSPITLALISPNILVVHPSVPAKSVKELMALAKARPGDLNYAGAAPGTSPHLAAELFKAMARVNIIHVPYKGSGPGLNDLIAGQVQLMFPIAALAIPHVKSGRLRPLAVTSAQPSALVPGLPTIASSGLPGYESTQKYGVYAPAKTPAAIISRLNQEIVRVLNRVDVREKFFNAGAEVVGSQPAQLISEAKSDVARLRKVIRDAGIRDE